ncbi:hypothetical protein C8R44DRAFT_749850 [Mycena epipterygia]|nr:hypothetical protein C8R44DRAFT_749850 [Mycena epipterygia]
MSWCASQQVTDGRGVHQAETVATEVVTDFAAAGANAEEDWVGTWRAKSFQECEGGAGKDALWKTVFEQFCGGGRGGMDKVGTDVEAAIGFGHLAIYMTNRVTAGDNEMGAELSSIEPNVMAEPL